MFIIIAWATQMAGIAPFNVPPSAAFLQKIGLNVGPLPLLVHFGYGATFSMALVAFYEREVSTGKGIGLALVLWGLMMAVYSPIIGWGFFGIGGAGHQLAADHPLYLGNPVKYMGATLVLHLIYGAIIGAGNARWTVASTVPQRVVQSQRG